MFRNARLYLDTLRHLRLPQVLWRLWYMARRRLHLYRIPQGTRPAPGFDRECLRQLRAFLQACGNHGIHANGDIEALRNQAFCFLNRQAEHTGGIPWRDTAFPKLWRYQLNSFAFAREFAVNAVLETYLGDRDRARNWILDWIRENPPGNDASWDAGPVSDRLLNWALLIAAFDIHDEEIRNSYLLQVRWLEKWLEWDLRGNHLLKNACALVLASQVLNDVSLQDKALRLLQSQMAEQILPDGGHVERCPMYHAHALWDLLIVYAAHAEKTFFLKHIIASMTIFLDTTRHPDGEIPLFGDSVFRQAPATKALVALARELSSTTEAPFSKGVSGYALKPSGFYILGDSDRGHRMIVKTTPPLPRYQPGHSHADMLSYELSLKGLRFIIDSGVHGYAESPLREYCRSTRAHNVVQLDNLEQSEMWAVFRVARSARAGSVSFHADDTGATLEAYCMHPCRHVNRRQIRYDRKTSSWEVHDRVETTSNQHTLRSYIHFHPDCHVQFLEDEIIVNRESAEARIVLLTPGTVEIQPASSPSVSHWYCPEFGLSRACTVAVLKAFGSTTLDISYKIKSFESNKC